MVVPMFTGKVTDAAAVRAALERWPPGADGEGGCHRVLRPGKPHRIGKPGRLRDRQPGAPGSMYNRRRE